MQSIDKPTITGSWLAITPTLIHGFGQCIDASRHCIDTRCCRFTFEAPLPTSRLVRDVADRAQIGTQRSWKRPWGVGLLVAGVDKNGAKLYYNCPSGNFYNYKAMAIGSRSQVQCSFPLRAFETFCNKFLTLLLIFFQPSKFERCIESGRQIMLLLSTIILATTSCM